jgi:23S rRNA (cytidine1920-2'-O)/16S rRNA (cytidine1409-2'-O)-methyltransferase
MGLTGSRQRAQALIMAGKVTVDGRVIDKAGTEVDPTLEVKLKEDLPYVGRGGLKLEGALTGFKIDVKGLTAMDVGSSTGGFTDCLLQRGVKKVHAIDVGKGIIDVKLRNDDRVHLMEGCNIRHLTPKDLGEDLGEKVDIAVIDVSFISLKKVLPKVKEFLKEGGRLLALVKPQFEVGKGRVGKGGVVKDPALHKAVLEDISDFAVSEGFTLVGTMESPIKGAKKGNKEFWLYALV